MENNGKIKTQIPITDKDSQEIVVDIVMEGKSAYDIAVEKGFDGTLEEWLLSLHGKDGKDADVDGIQAQFDTVETRLDSTDAKLNNMTQDFTQHKLDYEEHKEDYNTLESEFTQHKEDYEEQRVLDLQEIESKRQQDQLKVAKVEKDINDYQSTMASVNVNQEAKQDVSGYGVVSLPKNSANGQVSASVKGSTLTNSVENGDFRNGTEGWQGAIGVSTSSVDNTLILTGDGTNAKPRLVTANGEGILSNKLFVRARVRVTNSECLTLKARLRYEGGSTASFISVDNPIQGEWYEGYFISTNHLVTAGLWFEHVYSDAATSDGKSMEVKDVIQIDLSQNPELANLSADEINELIPNYFEGTKSTISASRLKSVGKNLFDYRDKTLYRVNGGANYTITEKGITGTVGGGTINALFLKARGLKPNREYVLSTYCQSIHSSIQLWLSKVSDSNKLILPITRGRSDIVLESNEKGEFELHLRNPTSGAFIDFVLEDIQLEEGTQATECEPYTESTQYLPNVGELRSLPNGVKDEIRVSGGKAELVKRVSDDLSIPTSGWALSNKKTDTIGFHCDTTATNVYTESVTSVLPNIITTLPFAPTSIYNIINVEVEGISFARETAPGRIYVRILQNKLTTEDVAGFEEWLQNNYPSATLNYQLAEPIITPIEVSGTLLSNPSGTIYIEPYTTVAGIYNSDISILANELPIASIDKISKIDFTTGNETILDVSKAVIDVNKLSFTHPDLVDGDIVFFEYMYPQEITTLGESTIEYFDSRYTIKDSIVPNKFYKWELTVANGIPAINLVEVL